VCGWCVGRVAGFWMEQAHADEPPVVINALDRVSVQLELGDDGGREVNPAGVQLRKSDRLAVGVVQSLQQPLLLGVSVRHRRIVALPRDWARVECFQGALLPLGRLATGVLVAADRRIPARDSLTPPTPEERRWRQTVMLVWP
jgi:hypothetical protein